jgi:dTDP-4-amino-4,6-dideoxygalactose transaminase
MNDINATIGLSNLKKINYIVDSHISNAVYYSNTLRGVSGVTILDAHVNSKSAFWLYTILVERRDKLIEFMKTKNVMLSCVHKRNDVNTCFKKFIAHLPNLDIIEDQYVCIPVGWWVTTSDREYIVECIKEFYSSNHS